MIPLTVGSLFSGIRGFELGLERTGGFKTVWQCEIDPFCRKVLAKHWPDVPCFEDITKLGKEELSSLGRIDVICGGFPCQDISCAGKGAGIHAERSGLWWEMLRIIRLVRPKYVLVENVAALLNRGLDEVLGSLAESGYDAEWQMLRASEFGLPHRRERLFLVAYDASIIRRKGRVFCESREHRTPKQFRGLLSSENEFKTRGWSLQNESPFLRGVDGISSRIHIDRLISNEVHTCTYDVKKTHAGKALLELQSENGKEENGQPIGINERIQEKEVLLFPVLRELDDCTSRNHHETCCPEESAKSDQSKPMSEVWKNGSEIESASRGSSESVGCSNPLLKVPCGRGSEARELSDQEKSNMCDLRECVSSEGFSSSQNMLREVPIGNGKDKRKQEMALQMNRLRALGNAIVPQCAQFVGWCLLDSIRTEAAQ